MYEIQVLCYEWPVAYFGIASIKYIAWPLTSDLHVYIVCLSELLAQPLACGMPDEACRLQMHPRLNHVLHNHGSSMKLLSWIQHGLVRISGSNLILDSGERDKMAIKIFLLIRFGRFIAFSNWYRNSSRLKSANVFFTSKKVQITHLKDTLLQISTIISWNS